MKVVKELMRHASQSVYARSLLAGTEGCEATSPTTGRSDDFAREVRRSGAGDFVGRCMNRRRVVRILNLCRAVGVRNREGIDLKKQQLRLAVERFGATKKVPSVAKQLKEMVGTRRLELLTSTVSKRLSAVTYYTLTALTASL